MLNILAKRVQVQFSLISKGPQQMQTKALCDQLGIQLIAYSPLGLGAHGLYLHAWCLACGSLSHQSLTGVQPCSAPYCLLCLRMLHYVCISWLMQNLTLAYHANWGLG